MSRYILKKLLNSSRLYHLSEENHDGKIFRPRVPLSADGYDEDLKTNRVCFSRSISGAFLAINFSSGYYEYYLHVPDSEIPIDMIMVPTCEQVGDAEYTREVWVKCPVKMKCIGKLKIGYNKDTAFKSFSQWRPRVQFKYIERY